MENNEFSVCLLCLLKCDSSVQVFQPGETCSQVSQIVNDHFWFEPKASDSISNEICINCWEKLNDFHLFYLSVQKAHKVLTLIEVKEDIENENVTTPTCKEEFEIEALIELSKEAIIEESNEDFHADTSDEAETFNKETEHNYDEIEIGEYDEIEEKDVKRDPPSKSDLNFKSRKRKPLSEELLQRYFKMECEICLQQFGKYRDIQTHFKNVHNITGYLTCCNKKFFHKARILEHIERHECPDSFKCQRCNKIFADRPSLNNHESIHLAPEEKAYKCLKCPNRYYRKAQLERHFLVNHLPVEEKKFKCEKCSKLFASTTQLNAHTKTVHDGAYTHVCDVCAKVFKSKSFFEHHQKIAHGGSPLPKIQCTICGMWLKHEHSLRSHMIGHEDAKLKHICDICGKEAPNRKALRGHKSIVHNNKIYKCTICAKEFKKSLSLKEHLSIHTGEALYKCPHCPKKFNSGANMHSHRKKKHNKEWEENRNKRLNTSV